MVVREFIKEKGLKLYGGQALHEHLVLKDGKGLYKKDEFPDYDVFSPDAWDHAKELSKRLFEMGYSYVEAKPSILNDKQKEALEFIRKNVLGEFESTGVQKAINDAVFNLLDYIHIYPGGMNKLEDKDGNVLPDCFLMKRGSTALEFAFRIHTDIGKGFIKAMDVKKRITIGKEHPLLGGDVVEIMTK